MGSRFSSTPSWTYHLWGRAWVQWILQQKHSFVWWPFFHWMPHWKEVDSLVEAQQSFEEIHVFQWCSWTTSCSWCLQPWCESLWQVQHWKTFCSLYPRKQQTEIFYWSFIEWWLVFGFQQVAMEDFHWMQSRPFHRYCETSWELSSIVHDRALLPWLGFSCDRSEVCEFYFPAWFEAIQSWYFAFHVWQWQWCWLHSKRTRNKGTSSLWFLQILHFKDNHVVERWLWFVFDFKWCCFVLWWHSLQIFWDREWVPIFGISLCKSNNWTWPTTWDQSWQLAPQHDRQRKVRGILAIRRDIQVLGKWRDCWVQSSPFTISKEKNNSVGIHGPRSPWEVSAVAQQLSKWQKTSRSLWWYAVWTAKLTNKWGR